MKRDGYLLHLFAGPDQGFTLHRAWHQVGGEGWQLLEVDVERGEEQSFEVQALWGADEDGIRREDSSHHWRPELSNKKCAQAHPS